MTTGITFQNGNFLTGSGSAATLTQTGGVTAASLYNTNYLDKKYEYNNVSQSYEISYAGMDGALDTKITNLCSYISKGQEDKVIKAYDQLLEEMSKQQRYAQLISEDGDDTQLRAVARTFIEKEIGGDLEDFIRDNTRDARGVEAQKCYRGEFCDSTTQEELLSEMCNIVEEEGHLNMFERGWHSFWGGIALGFNNIFGDGKKH